ncbi:DUF1877 family protein [Streptomyces aquilus]|uniref:DUF1877 family protein n=1 Tax=Streptomyces aquilus TaxID=2548456 RepID=UPI0036AD8287
MGFDMHLRAVQDSEVRLDHVWLEEFMGAAWDGDVHRAEWEAGIAESLSKDFGPMHDLYESAALLPEGRDGAWELPVFGGELVPGSGDEEAPFVHLSPETVRQAAAFLTHVSFDALWDAAGPKLYATFGPGWAEEDVKGIYRRHHADLGDFYRRTAADGKAVVKAFWY